MQGEFVPYLPQHYLVEGKNVSGGAVGEASFLLQEGDHSSEH